MGICVGKTSPAKKYELEKKDDSSKKKSDRHVKQVVAATSDVPAQPQQHNGNEDSAKVHRNATTTASGNNSRHATPVKLPKSTTANSIHKVATDVVKLPDYKADDYVSFTERHDNGRLCFQYLIQIKPPPPQLNTPAKLYEYHCRLLQHALDRIMLEKPRLAAEKCVVFVALDTTEQHRSPEVNIYIDLASGQGEFQLRPYLNERVNKIASLNAAMVRHRDRVVVTDDADGGEADDRGRWSLSMMAVTRPDPDLTSHEMNILSLANDLSNASARGNGGPHGELGLLGHQRLTHYRDSISQHLMLTAANDVGAVLDADEKVNPTCPLHGRQLDQLRDVLDSYYAVVQPQADGTFLVQLPAFPLNSTTGKSTTKSSTLTTSASTARLLFDINVAMLQRAVDEILSKPLPPIVNSATASVLSPSRSYPTRLTTGGTMTPASAQSTPAKNASLAVQEDTVEAAKLLRPLVPPTPSRKCDLLELTVNWDLKSAALTKDYKIKFLVESTWQLLPEADDSEGGGYLIRPHLLDRLRVQPAVALALLRHDVPRYLRLTARMQFRPRQTAAVDKFNRMALATSRYVTGLDKMSDYDRATHSQLLTEINRE